VHSDRLTRQELTWLLTQEARTAAERLRKGVAVLAAPEIRSVESPALQHSVEPELDALDDAMKMLATLHTGSTSRGRRGRIDLAALLWEVAPNARVSIEPGAGTEVFGEETELRRMLQVLVGSSSPTGSGTEMGTPELAIKREGGEIRVSVTLGPDASANAETERAWLSRMALRYGGRFELEGGVESILLPADGANEERELDVLRRELTAAQKQGEAYARELATVFAYSQSPPPRFSSKPAEANVELSVLVGMAAGMGAELRGIFSVIERELGAARDGSERASGALAQKLASAGELVTNLVRIAQCPVHESLQHVDVADAVRAAMAEELARATRKRVTLTPRVPASLDVESRPGALLLAARLLIAEAVSATPPGGEVKVSVAGDSATRSVRLLVEDGGAPIPTEAWSAVVSAQLDPASLGRPSTITLFCVQTIAHHLGAYFGTVQREGVSRGAVELRIVGSGS
jgi:two-component system OmpR family sensor kinase